ncbi:MAG: UDP-N-acetylmuramate--L-alanine ligase [Eubacteriales bacterium]
MSCNDISGILDSAKKLFFIGIGGISMSSLAFVFSSKGYIVSGSDRAESDMTRKLSSSGIDVFYGHDAKNVEGADAVIYTGAIPSDNPELSFAREKGIPLIYRADALCYLMRRYKTRIGIAGSHGKSTCTAMISHILITAGKDPSVMCGAETTEMGGAYRAGEGEDFVFEACEYKDSFLSFVPSIAVILNIDLDHTDYFTDGIDQIKASFRKYAGIPFEVSDMPLVISNADDDNTVSALAGIKTTTFGIKNKNADFCARNIVISNGAARFDIIKKGEYFAHIALSVPGEHNIYNALASAAACDFARASAKDIETALSGFSGLHRRFEYMGSANGARVYIDYAHHPKEIISSVKAAKNICAGNIYCIFEPHTYSRTAALFDEFVSSFDGAEKVIYTDIYAAREINTFGVSSKALAEATENGEYAFSYEEAARRVLLSAGKNDVILILGAGTVNKIADIILGK